MSKISNREEFEKQDIFGVGAPNDAFAQYFVGNSYLKPLTEFGKCPVFLANVTFEPGCRNNWHIHHAKSGGGQLLICTTGEGWYQEEGKAAVSLTPGTVITIPHEGSYEEIVEQGKDEVNHGYTPEIMPVSIDGYDRIIIGSPTWWYTMAPAVKTFIESTDFTGKTVVPFITHGGWPAHAVTDMIDGLHDARIENEYEIQFDSTGGDELVTERMEIDKWISNLI